MIRTLEGIISHQLRDGVVVAVNGVGYLVAVPLRELPAIGQVVRYFTHHHIRDDHQALFGFSSPEALETFQRLLTVPSIGPKSALAILSVASVAELTQAVEQGNATFFSSIPGIGSKSAAKIIVELKGQLASTVAESGGAELHEALVGLGYREHDVATVIRSMPAELPDLSAQLSWALRRLGRS